MSWLTSIEIQRLVNTYGDDKTRNAFKGIFAMDTLPQRVLHLPLLLIVNTQTSNLPGEHWKAIYISTDKTGEVFDSLATPIGIYLQKWMNTFTRKWTVSKLTIQNPLAATCGAFTLYYVLTRLNAKSMQDCVKIFSKVLHENDKLMELFVEELRHVKK